MTDTEVPATGATGATERPLGEGRVAQVSVSSGGVPKLPVERAWVGRLGLGGDGHDDRGHHGGPHRAVCLFSLEAIRRVQADGHPIAPGTAGENLTTEGIELSSLPLGTRLRMGGQLVLEIASPTSPCRTIRHSFSDGRFARISFMTHPRDSRMYARVLIEGEVRPGDPIRVLPSSPDSIASTHRVLDRVDDAEMESHLRTSRAARDAGYDIRIMKEGELLVGAAPALPGPAFNHASGLGNLPHLVPLVEAHFRAAGCAGWLPMDEPPWPGAAPEWRFAVMAGEPRRVPAAEVQGVVVRELDASEAATWGDLLAADFPPGSADGQAFRALAARLLRTRGVHAFVAHEGGRPIAAATLHVHGGVGLLRAAVVVADARGLGIQGALIAARTRLAADLGCELVAALAIQSSASERNLATMGLDRIWERAVYRFDPGKHPTPA
ncbi:MAG: MOSC domain-containing protein [Chloroflexi bacterium]|nr:MOSC domain-containing protein [Chloroflexota bacterium]